MSEIECTTECPPASHRSQKSQAGKSRWDLPASPSGSMREVEERRKGAINTKSGRTLGRC